MAKKRKAVKKARKTSSKTNSKPVRSAAKRKSTPAAKAHQPADEGFFASFLKLFAPPDTKDKKA